MILDSFYPLSVALCLLAVIGIYFCSNPVGHGGWFMARRFINWFPLGLTYAFLCMGRYNLTVAQGALGTLMSKQDFGTIFAVGTCIYAFSFLVNGPLIDKKLGGKRGMLISAVGVALSNVALGVLTWLIVARHWKVNVLTSFTLLYAVNMYFQSFGSMSIIKVKAYWFHVRERGVFGAIFGTLISIGVYFAFDWGAKIISLTKADATGWLHDIFASAGNPVDATWAVFYVPAGILIAWAVLDAWLIKDTPEDAGFPHLDTCDASSGQMHLELSVKDLLKRIFTSKLMLLVATVELTGGVFRYAMMNWYKIFAGEVKQPGAEFFSAHWGWYTCVFGIVGGFAGGLISDRFFQSRRGPPTAWLCGIVLVFSTAMPFVLFTQPLAVGWSAVLIIMASIGITSLMSGTAATDFGGRKATATSMGIINGFAYLGSSIQSYFIGHLVPAEKTGEAATFMGLNRGWHWWPIFVIPFAVIGLICAIKIWHDLPEATRRYNKSKEEKTAPVLLVTE